MAHREWTTTEALHLFNHDREKAKQWIADDCPIDGIKTRMWRGKGYRRIRLDDTVRDMKWVLTFCLANSLRSSCIVKMSGGYYHLGRDGIMVRLFTHLDGITFRELYHEIKRADLISERPAYS